MNFRVFRIINAFRRKIFDFTYVFNDQDGFGMFGKLCARALRPGTRLTVHRAISVVCDFALVLAPICEFSSKNFLVEQCLDRLEVVILGEKLAFYVYFDMRNPF